jgi:histidyl-tRNA synthetase
MKFSAPRGTKDILPEEAARWQWLEANFREQCRRYGFGEIRTPIFEETELFARGTGEETEIVTKQMYTFNDRGDRSLTLRPEGTPGVVRAYLQNGLADQGGVHRLFYFGPFFRYERPQAGRFRQFHQAGVEVFGAPGPDIDAEVIALFVSFIEALGIKGWNLKINSMGCTACRARYREALRAALAPVVGQLCDWCQERYKGNTLRILDEKRPSCKALLGELPSILDYLDDECRAHFDGLRSQLDILGIPYEIDSRVVRGLDYYTRTVFEAYQPGIGAQDALGGGGRYDGLVELFGGKPTPGMGWAAGVERLLTATEQVQQAQRTPLESKKQVVFVTGEGPAATKFVPHILFGLREIGTAAVSAPLDKNLKSQLKAASRAGSKFVVLTTGPGGEQFEGQTFAIKDMDSGKQELVNEAEVPAKVQELMKKQEEQEPS